jgi:hypothetical protein
MVTPIVFLVLPLVVIRMGVTAVNAQLAVPAGGQVKVPTHSKQFAKTVEIQL